MKRTFIDTLSLLLFVIILLITGYMLFAWRAGKFEKHPSRVYSVDISQSNILVSASANELFLWNKRKCTNRLTGHKDAVKSVVFSHSGALLASGSIDKSIKVWSMESKKVIKTLYGHTAGVNKVAFDTADQYVISAGYDNRLIIWDWKRARAVKSFSIRHTWFSINKENVLAYVDTNCTVQLLDLFSLKEIRPLGHYCGLPVFHPTGKIIAMKNLHKSVFTFIDAGNGQMLSELDITRENATSQVSTFTFTPDGTCLIAGIWGGSIQVWDWNHKKLARTLRGAIMGSVEDFAFNRKNELLSASGDRSVKVWDWENGDLKMVLGNGLYQARLKGVLSVFILLTLVSCFSGMMQTADNKYSSLAILSILTVWSYGVLFILYLARSYAYCNTHSLDSNFNFGHFLPVSLWQTVINLHSSCWTFFRVHTITFRKAKNRNICTDNYSSYFLRDHLPVCGSCRIREMKLRLR